MALALLQHSVSDHSLHLGLCWQGQRQALLCARTSFWGRPGALLPPRARRPCRCARAAALPRANEINKWWARRPATDAPVVELHHALDVVCVHTRGDNDAREDDTDDGEQEDDLYFNRCGRASVKARVNACTVQAGTALEAKAQALAGSLGVLVVSQARWRCDTPTSARHVWRACALSENHACICVHRRNPRNTRKHSLYPAPVPVEVSCGVGVCSAASASVPRRDTSRLVARVLTARAATKILLQLQETDLFVHRWFGEFCMSNPPNEGDEFLLKLMRARAESKHESTTSKRHLINPQVLPGCSAPSPCSRDV